MTPDPLARAVAGFHALPTPDRPPDAAVLARLTPPTPARRSRILTRAAVFAVAASVLAAGFLLVGGSSVALADVVKAAGRHSLVKYQATFWHEQKTQAAYEQKGTAWADLRAPRHRYEDRKLTFNEHVESRSVGVVDWAADRTLNTLAEDLIPNKPVEKFFQKFYDAEAHKYPRRSASLWRAITVDCEPADDQRKPFLARLRDIATNPKAVARKDPDHGPAVTRFRIEDGPKTTELWVDGTTTLPVRMRYEVFQPMTGETLRWTFTDHEWDPKLPDGVKSADELFSVKPPAGYELTDHTKKD